MCRIYGYLGTQNISDEVLNQVAAAQKNGGPDGQYLKTNKNWALGNNRLAIQDLNNGTQPFYGHNTYAVFNGEIYNHHELKKQLIKKGYTFQDDCDGSVIIPLYELYGEDFVKYLDGMFAIAILDDRSEQKLILASDACSIKSVYYFFDQATDTLFFSSELPSLLSFPIAHDLRLEALDEYLTGRSIWHNHTFYKNIDSLPPSCILVKKAHQEPKLFQYESHIKSHWNNTDNFNQTALHFNQLLENEIQQIVKADVPVCVVTSGGLDSSYITAIAAKQIAQLNCFNIAYEGSWPSDERHFAKEVSDFYGAKYHQVIIKENEFPDILAKTIAHLGQPNSAPHSLSTYALFKAIKQAGFKVAITGEGADEFFGGYDRFKNATFNSHSYWLDQYFDVMCATTLQMRNNAYSAGYKDFLTSSNHHLLESAKEKIIDSEKNLNSRLKALLRFDQTERFTSYILRRVDHLSMANSVEVRVPFCQPRVASFSRSLPDDFLLNPSAVKRIIYQGANDKLPKSVLQRPKQPFTLPITAMLRKGFILFDILYETLNSQPFLARGIFDYAQIKKMIQQQCEAPSNHTADLLWSIMMLELWLQHTQSKLRL